MGSFTIDFHQCKGSLIFPTLNFAQSSISRLSLRSYQFYHYVISLYTRSPWETFCDAQDLVHPAGSSVNFALREEIKDFVWVLQWWPFRKYLEAWTNNITVNSKIIIHTYIFILGKPSYVGIFPLYLRMALIFTDFQQRTWLL